ncbi:hypothetical protein [Cutibacterium avidum]|uniref:hypothetical protein n=1 Tax=Cutibacterium avidum TaxID=33010 RepID=UPI001C333E7E|nr:hypothetical protein [Cutibacterium avidum]MBS6415482.1 hypothetical protein [Mycobacteriales bacterium]BCQ03620.1 hypothetical protein TPCV4_20640 [Cutibacterium avidum]
MEEQSVLDAVLAGAQHRVAKLRYHGELRAYLLVSAASLGISRNGGETPWLWFTVCWLDGRAEPPFDDYGPDWVILNELKRGRLTFQQEPSLVKKSRIFGVYTVNNSSDIEYEVDWVSSDEGERIWHKYDGVVGLSI